jgi:hypothetical protein
MIRAADDVLSIRVAMDQIEREEGPRCPNSSTKARFDCVREASPCPEGCSNRDEWKRLHQP